MPKRAKQSTQQVGETELGRKVDFDKVAERRWLPYLDEMLAADMQLALKADKQGSDTRERIYNRLFGKPVEMQRVDEKRAIQLIIRPVESLDDAEQPNVIEGECTVVGDNDLVLPLADGQQCDATNNALAS